MITISLHMHTYMLFISYGMKYFIKVRLLNILDYHTSK